MEESFSTVSFTSSVNVKSRKPESLYRCNSTSPSHEDHANVNRPLGSELSCTYDRNSSSSQPKSDHRIKEQGDSVALTEVSSSDKNGSYGDNNIKLDLDLTLWFNHVERKHTSPEPNPPIAGGMDRARILTARNFQVPAQNGQDNNIDMYFDSRNMVNAEEGFKRSYHKAILGQPRLVQCSDSGTLKENQQGTPVINWNEAKHLAFSLNTSKQSQSFATNHSGMASVDGLCNFSQASQLSNFDHNSTNKHFTANGDSSTTKGEEVIGWPPIRSYRRNSLGSLPKPSGENQQDAMVGSFVQGDKNSLYVKVNMDGMPIGRKVDLNASESYEILAQDLENMFQLTTQDHIRAYIPMGNRPSRLLDPAADFVLTYEDSEGDCMLIGDIPWKMFLNTVKRLRIMKNLDTNAFAQMCSKKRKAT